MWKAFYTCVLLLSCFTRVQAQVRTMNGYLRDSLTRQPISGGTIINATTGKSVKTNSYGFFRLDVANHNRIYAVANAYRFDTLTYSPLFVDTVTIFLSPTGSLLPGVTVTSQYSKYQLDSIERRRAFEEARGTVMPTVASTPSLGFGLTINLDRFFKDKYKYQKRQERTFNKTEQATYVFYRFPPEMVSSYTGLKGEQLQVFMLRYTPSYTWLREHPSDVDVMYYLNEKLKEFKRRERGSQ